MTEVIGRLKPGENITGYPTADIVAGRFVKVSATKTAYGDYSVAHCGAGEPAIGVAESDADADLAEVYAQHKRLNIIRSGAVARVEVGTGGVTAGEEVESDATGKVVSLDSGKPLGIAMETKAAAAFAEIALY